jgi:hypothetical protein
MRSKSVSIAKIVSMGEECHPVSFQRVRNTVDWPEYFTTGQFSVKVLLEGRAHYLRLSEQLEEAAVR